MNRNAGLAVATVALACASLGGAEMAPGAGADLVLRGGRVWAGKGLPPATAIAMRDGRVAAVGSDAEVARGIGGATEKGTLERGRLANVVVFARDLFAVAPRQILDTPVDLTIVGGRIVFQR